MCIWHVRPLRANQERRQGRCRRHKDVQTSDENRVRGQGRQGCTVQKRRSLEPRRRRKAHRAGHDRDLLRRRRKRQLNRSGGLQRRGRLRRPRPKDHNRRRQPVLPYPEDPSRHVQSKQGSRKRRRSWHVPRDTDRSRRSRLRKVRLFGTKAVEDCLRLLYEEEEHIPSGVVLPEKGRHRGAGGVYHERRRRCRHRSTLFRNRNRKYL